MNITTLILLVTMVSTLAFGNDKVEMPADVQASITKMKISIQSAKDKACEELNVLMKKEMLLGNLEKAKSLDTVVKAIQSDKKTVAINDKAAQPARDERKENPRNMRAPRRW